MLYRNACSCRMHSQAFWKCAHPRTQHVLTSNMLMPYEALTRLLLCKAAAFLCVYVCVCVCVCVRMCVCVSEPPSEPQTTGPMMTKFGTDMWNTGYIWEWFHPKKIGSMYGPKVWAHWGSYPRNKIRNISCRNITA